MSWFKKKSEESSADQSSDSSGDAASDENAPESSPAVSASVEMELTKIKSQLEALNEVRKANAEQFTRISEQVGELRGALMDSNKAIGTIEVAATRAVDLVNSVQPDKLMIEVRKEDSKVEALRANIEANELMMKDIMKEIKGMREQMNFYKGLEQVAKLNDEVKQELVEIKKMEGVISKHADRVETIFIEVEKKFSDFEKFNQAVKELDRSFKKISSDFDKMRVATEEKADKKEFVKLVDKFSDFEKHTSNILKLLDQKSKNTVVELNTLFDQLKTQLEARSNIKFAVKGLSVDDAMATPASKNASSGASPETAQDAGADAVSAAAASTPSAQDATQAGSTPTDAAFENKQRRNIFGFLKK